MEVGAADGDVAYGAHSGAGLGKLGCAHVQAGH